jgi:hypothetical protein
LTAQDFGAKPADDRIPVEVFDEKLEKLGLPQLHYFLSTHEGSISKKELEDFLATKHMNDAIDRVQRRKRRHLDLDEPDKKAINLSYQEKDLAIQSTYPQSNMMDHFRRKVGQQRSENLSQFRLFDQNKDGFISKPEFLKYAQSNLGFSFDNSSKVFDSIGGGKEVVTFGYFVKTTNPEPVHPPSSQPSGEYTRKLATKSAAATSRQHTDRLAREMAEKPHVMRPDMNTRSSARPAYTRVDTFESVMAGRDASMEQSGRGELNAHVDFQAKERSSAARRLERVIERHYTQDLFFKQKAEAERVKHPLSAERTAFLQHSKQGPLRNYNLRLNLLDVTK